VLRFLIVHGSYSSRFGKYTGNMTPINLRRDLFIRLAPYARVPSVYLQLLTNNTAACVLATPEVPSNKSHGAVRDEHLSTYPRAHILATD
jgi:hypothetical protein